MTHKPGKRVVVEDFTQKFKQDNSKNTIACSIVYEISSSWDESGSQKTVVNSKTDFCCQGKDKR